MQTPAIVQSTGTISNSTIRNFLRLVSRNASNEQHGSTFRGRVLYRDARTNEGVCFLCAPRERIPRPRELLVILAPSDSREKGEIPRFSGWFSCRFCSTSFPPPPPSSGCREFRISRRSTSSHCTRGNPHAPPPSVHHGNRSAEFISLYSTLIRSARRRSRSTGGNTGRRKLVHRIPRPAGEFLRNVYCIEYLGGRAGWDDARRRILQTLWTAHAASSARS